LSGKTGRPNPSAVGLDRAIKNVATKLELEEEALVLLTDSLEVAEEASEREELRRGLKYSHFSCQILRRDLEEFKQLRSSRLKPCYETFELESVLLEVVNMGKIRADLTG